jgi:hypothetical protein
MAISLSPQQLAAYAASAGFTGPALDTATAIALAESSGNPYVVGDSNLTPGGSVGLWQINLAAHPQYTAAELMDPQANADAAFAAYQQAGGQFTPWTTFKTGAYSAYLPSTSLVPVSDYSADDNSVDDSQPSVAFLGSSSSPSLLLIGGLLAVLVAVWWVGE